MKMWDLGSKHTPVPGIKRNRDSRLLGGDRTEHLDEVRQPVEACQMQHRLLQPSVPHIHGELCSGSGFILAETLVLKWRPAVETLNYYTLASVIVAI